MKYTKTCLTFALTFFLMLTLSACFKADRNNKWDPEADNYVGDDFDNDLGGESIINQGGFIDPQNKFTIEICDSRAIVAWEEYYDGDNDTHIYANTIRFDGSGWKGMTQVDGADENNNGRSVRPDLAIDPDGNAYVIWAEASDISGYAEINAAYFDKDPEEWDGGTQIGRIADNNVENADKPLIEMNSDGWAVALWRDNSDGDAYCNIFDGGSWIYQSQYGATLPTAQPAWRGTYGLHQAGINTDYIWLSYSDSSTPPSLMVDAYQTGSDWLTAPAGPALTGIDTLDNSDTSLSLVRHNQDGFIAWTRYDNNSSTDGLYVKQYLGSWSDSLKIIPMASSCTSPPYFVKTAISNMNDVTKMIVVFRNCADGNIYAAIYKTDRNWEVNEWRFAYNDYANNSNPLNETSGVHEVISFDVAMDDAGNAVVVWGQQTDAGNHRIYAVYYEENNDNWHGTQIISENGAGAKVAMTGNNIIIVYESEGDLIAYRITNPYNLMK